MLKDVSNVLLAVFLSVDNIMKYINNLVLHKDWIVVRKDKRPLPTKGILLANDKLDQDVFEIVDCNGSEIYTNKSLVLAKGINALKFPFEIDTFAIPVADIVAKYELV